MPEERIGLANAISRLSTSKADFDKKHDYFSLSCGGIRVYAPNRDALDEGLISLEKAILKELYAHFLLTRSSVEKLVRERLNIGPSKLLFTATIARLRRLGTVDVLVCSAAANKPYYVFFHCERAAEVRKATNDTLSQLKTNETVSIRQIQARFFPSKPWGSYAAAAALVEALTWRGLATQVDKDLYAWPKEVNDAMR
jgi:hypothetical protein